MEVLFLILVLLLVANKQQYFKLIMIESIQIQIKIQIVIFYSKYAT